MMGHHEKMINGDEQDVFTRWRHMMYWKSGQIRKTKRRFNKRQRHNAKMELRYLS